MNKTAVVTGADRGLGLGMTKRLLEQGWNVFAGSYMADWPELQQLAQAEPERLRLITLDVSNDESVQEAGRVISDQAGQVDLLINNAGISTRQFSSIHELQDDEEVLRIFNVNAVGPMRMVQALLPLMERSEWKRLCFVSSEAGSLARSHRDNWYGYCMSKTALNRGVQCLFDEFRPMGYTFRLYHPGWVKSYMSGQLSTEGELDADDAARMAVSYFLRNRYQDQETSEEDRLVMRDWLGREWPW
ncbi:SDR family NAD(P)-dependent oxidoreductase [Paenibacillus dokdonensis]|uniref:SDR family NAD(P)-dependent oxidoreductase n=1 Tax=Paenibacillus dokdonensis TaxID=2567944 RepID=A0ABU6GI04_9BACL|nr:SDR family NAD(P)-dependent oxidoreductase [Paenibacillus dokdonensis]MEC0239389.1 SDR family NAD(P)-dependent oxidoreductase [Paenibacillus dokdonensis]